MGVSPTGFLMNNSFLLLKHFYFKDPLVPTNWTVKCIFIVFEHSNLFPEVYTI